ncbi:TlpA family protein disulfide reductase [Streptomyces sp. BE133]|uniref:TlpA family protein disulfide reductase n=1 Tax=Streptomyces sp. BE133 TaxID=3002523 RepID=UPI002E7891FD|nr:redoxin family protein [Streptomyces sp. BE133]MEE1805884.1 redoxin family protein [Streptomyces sp. BE133]
MSYLIAAVVLVGALCLLDLLLTVGLIRRLRAQQAPRTSADGFAGEGVLPPGAIVGAFETRTVDGSPLRSRDLSTGTVVVFLSPGCPPCHAQLPRVVAALGAAPANRAVAVVAGGMDGDPETEQLLKELGPVARVVHEPGKGPVTEAFAARAFPVMCRVRAAGDELVVEAVGEHVLPTPVPVAQ